MYQQTGPLAAPDTVDRVSASVILAGVLGLALLGWIFQPALATGIATNTPPVKPVRVVDAPKMKAGCADQTWPYIDARCLTRAADTPQQPAAATQPAAPPTPQLVTAAPPAAAAEAQPQPLRSEAETSARPAVNTAAVATPDPAAINAEPSPAIPPPPPGAEPRQPDERMASAPAAMDAAQTAGGIGAAAAAASKLGARTEPRHGARHGGRSFGLFGFRIGRF